MMAKTLDDFISESIPVDDEINKTEDSVKLRPL